VNDPVDLAITAGHLAHDRADRPGVSHIAGMVRCLDPEECKSARVRAISDDLGSKANASGDERSGRGFAGLMPGSRGSSPERPGGA